MDTIYWDAFKKACKNNDVKIVRGFCEQEKGFIYFAELEAFHLAAENRSLEVFDVLLDYVDNPKLFKGHECLVTTLLSDDFDGDWAKRDQLVLKLIRKVTWKSDSWDLSQYAELQSLSSLYAALKNAPETFQHLWYVASEQEKIDTTFFLLTRWTSANELPKASYETLFSDMSGFIGGYRGLLEAWFQTGSLSTSPFAYAAFRNLSEDSLLKKARYFIEKKNLLMLRVLLASEHWKKFDCRENTFALVRFAHQEGATEIKKFFLDDYKIDGWKTLSCVIEAVCEMPDLKRKRDDEERTEEKKKRK